jgi:threonine dehydrogenase-like Zn-dependent dehydrogenase
LVEVAFSSLCGTDTDFFNGVFDQPRPSGHEFTGRIAKTGPGVKKFSEGDRVVASWGVGCGKCPSCKTGLPQMCDNVILFEGTHAEYICIPHADRALALLPDKISSKAAIVMACALSTGGYGVKMSSIRPTDTVIILGLGPVGLSMVLSAAADKAKKIIGIDGVAFRREKALALGAHETGDPTDKEWLRSNETGADVVLIATANPAAVATAVRLTRKGGRITVIGSQADAVLPFERFDHYGLHLFGTWSMIGGEYMEQVVARVASGIIDARKLESLVTHTFPLEEIKKAYECFASQADNVIKVAISSSARPGNGK